MNKVEDHADVWVEGILASRKNLRWNMTGWFENIWADSITGVAGHAGVRVLRGSQLMRQEAVVRKWGASPLVLIITESGGRQMKWARRRKSAALICVWLFLSSHVVPMLFRTTSTCIHILHQSSVLVFRSPSLWPAARENWRVVTYSSLWWLWDSPSHVRSCQLSIKYCSVVPCPQYPQNKRGAYSFSCLGLLLLTC